MDGQCVSAPSGQETGHGSAMNEHVRKGGVQNAKLELHLKFGAAGFIAQHLPFLHHDTTPATWTDIETEDGDGNEQHLVLETH